MMFRVDKIKSLFDCDICHKQLVEPIVLACGNFICKCHLDKLLAKATKSKHKNSFTCELCHEDHSIPKRGFVVNTRIAAGLKLGLNTLTASPAFNACKQQLDEARKNVANIERLEETSENWIYEYFADIKRQVGIRQEDLKSQIDQYSDDINKSIDNTLLGYMKLSRNCSQISASVEKSKKDVKRYSKQFDTLELDDKRFEVIKRGVEAVNEELHSKIAEYQDSLHGNKKYTFQFDELPIEDVFGRVYDFKKFDSVLLDTNQTFLMYRLGGFSLDQKWKLKYRASRDGFNAKNFHAKCDGVKSTLTVIKSTNGNIFGGFTEKAWSSVNAYVTDASAFVFSLVNKENRPFQALCTNCQNAIYCGSSYGPTFGAGQDIYVSSDSNANHSSFSALGCSFQHLDYEKGSAGARSILAGSCNFKTLEIEVFTRVT